VTHAVARRGAAAIAALALLVTLWYLPDTARSVWRDTRNGHATPRAEREVAPAHVVGILAPGAIIAAREVIPRDATYFVTAGTDAPEASPNARFYVGFFAAFSLLPRRAVTDVRAADWVLSYGGDLRHLGVGFRRVVRLGPGVAAAEVAR
jgi:hypothetical protein